MRKPSNRRERIELICRKKGNRIQDLFSLMTDREVKNYFDAIYPIIKSKPDATMTDEVVQCMGTGLPEPMEGAVPDCQSKAGGGRCRN